MTPDDQGTCARCGRKSVRDVCDDCWSDAGPRIRGKLFAEIEADEHALCQCPNAVVHGDELCPTTAPGKYCDWCETGHHGRRPMTADEQEISDELGSIGFLSFDEIDGDPRFNN